MNYPVLISFIILITLVIGYLIGKNQKDKKKLEDEAIQAELPEEKDDNENV